jgi:SSS family solute:Na+ symporter
MGLGFVLSFGYWCTDFLVVQRAMAAESMTAARRTPLIAAVPKMLFPFLVILPGMIALALGGEYATGGGQGLVPAKVGADGVPLVDTAGRVVLDYDLATRRGAGVRPAAENPEGRATEEREHRTGLER